MFFFGRFYAHWFDDTSELALKSPAQVYGRMGRRIAVWKFCVGFSAALHSTVMMEMGWKWQEDTTRLTSFVVKLDKLSEDASQVLYIDSNFLSQFMRGFKISFYFSELHSHNVWKLSKKSQLKKWDFFFKMLLQVEIQLWSSHESLPLIEQSDSLFQIPSHNRSFHPKNDTFLHL